MAKESIKKTKKNSGENMEKMPLSRVNYILMAVCIAMIAIGFALMTGSANEGTTFNYDIFESRRTVVGPTIALLGFVLMAPAILWRSKSGKDTPNQDAQ